MTDKRGILNKRSDKRQKKNRVNLEGKKKRKKQGLDLSFI